MYEKPTVPLPVPLFPDDTVSQLVLLETAVQLQPEVEVTEIEPLPDEEVGEIEVGEIE